MKNIFLTLLALAATAFGEGSETLKIGTATHNVQSPLTTNWTGTTQNFTGATVIGLSTGGAFTDLSDVPNSYTGQSLKTVRVNVGETGLEFATGGGGGTWGSITGTLSSQTDLQAALDAKVPTSLTLTIAGTALDLSTNRAWTLDTITGLSSTGIVKRTGANALTTITDSSSNWDTAYTDRLKWDGGATGLTAATGRTSLGATTVGSSLFTLVNPSAVTFIRLNADNTVDARSASDFRSDIGAGTGSGDALVSNPLSQFASTTSAQLAGVLSDETGSGVAVFGTAPNITSPTGIVKGDVGLGNVTNATQTLAVVVPNTAPSAGDILVGNAGGTAYAHQALSGSGATATLSSAGVLTLSAIPNTTLTNSAITIAGTSTALGGSISLDTISGVSSNGFLKRTSTNTWTNDSSTYLTGNQTVTLSGDATGSGATAITVTNANLPTGVTMAGSLLATAITAPGTPASGKGSLYVDSTSKNLAVKDDAGVVKHGVQTKASASTNFLTAINDAGSVSAAQPAFTDISGIATTAQGAVKSGGTTGQVLAKASNSDYDLVWNAAGSGTVTATGGALTSNSVVLGAGTTDTKVSTGIITDGASKLTLGLNTSTLGQVKLFGSTSGDATIQPAAVAGTATVVTLPNASSTLPIYPQQMTFTGPTAARTVTFPDANWTAARTDAANTFTGHQTVEGVTSTGATGTGNFVFGTAPTTSNEVVGTQAAGDNSTKAASTAYVDGNTTNHGGWKEVYVSGSDFTTSSTTLVTITGLTTATLSNSTMYEVEAVLYFVNAADTTGMKFGWTAGGTGSAATGALAGVGTSTAAGSCVVLGGVVDTASAVFGATSGLAGSVKVGGLVITKSTGTATLSMQILKVTSNTLTIKVGSVMRYRQAGQ
jgi:hypothetical protein